MFYDVLLQIFSVTEKIILFFSKQKLLGVTPYIKWGSNVATNRYYKVGLNNDCDQCQFKRIS